MKNLNISWKSLAELLCRKLPDTAKAALVTGQYVCSWLAESFLANTTYILPVPWCLTTCQCWPFVLQNRYVPAWLSSPTPQCSCVFISPAIHLLRMDFVEVHNWICWCFAASQSLLVCPCWCAMTLMLLSYMSGFRPLLLNGMCLKPCICLKL